MLAYPLELMFEGGQLFIVVALEVNQLIACARSAANQLVQLELQRTRVSILGVLKEKGDEERDCLLYTSPSPRDS